MWQKVGRGTGGTVLWDESNPAGATGKTPRGEVGGNEAMLWVSLQEGASHQSSSHSVPVTPWGGQSTHFTDKMERQEATCPQG